MNTAILNPVQALVSAASLATGVPESRIYSSSRTPLECSIRWSVFIILRRRGWSLTDIGNAFCRDHSTVINGLRRASVLMDSDTWFSALVSYLSKTIQQPQP